jgi:murein DD-endopeptidase MepM/ murein hydrolase activator NlpD
VNRKLWVPGAVLGLVVISSAAFLYSDSSIERDLAEQARRTEARAEHLQSQVVLFSESAVPRGLPFNVFLQRFGIDAGTTAELAASVQPVFDLRQLRAGNELAIGRSVLGELRALRYRIDADRMLWVRPEGGDFRAEIQTIPSVTETVGVGGEVHGSLFEGITDIGERPELAMRLADIFGYDLDFYTDTRPGDTFRVVLERKKLTNGTVVSYGRILAAEYNNDGHAYRAILFHDGSGRETYFTPEGKSLKKAFLHSPLKFAAPVTSHFSAHRFHPILRRYRPHLGTDYGAPIGTPVQSIGEGKVVFAGRKGGAGNLVEVLHTNGYETYYMHLSRVLVRAGQRVNEGQRIGLVGMTGLATGPHLDFRIERHGQFLNFERLSLPSAEPVARRDWNEFAAVRNHAIGQLPNLGAILARNRAPASGTSSR